MINPFRKKTSAVPSDLGLGKTLADLTTGFTGVAIQRIEHLNGNIQYGLQPQAAGTSYPDSMWIDQHLLSVVDEGLADRVTEPTEPVVVKLGQEVQDTVSGFKGIADVRVLYINGCTAFRVVPKILESGKKLDSEWIDHKRLKVIGDGVRAPENQAPADANGRRPGGPAMRAPVR